MNELDMQFHTAVFGGFQKQDVMTYLESSTQENNQKLANLQRELNEAQESRSQAEQARDKAEVRLSGLETENKSLSATVASQQSRLTELQAQLQELSEERDRLREERDRLAAEVDTLKPQADGYEAIKDRTAGIELEAHGRAQIIENEAHEKALRVQKEMDSWCEHLKGSYAGIRRDADAAIARAGQEMERLKLCLSQLSSAYTDHEQILEQLQKNVDQVTGPKAPAPIPEEEV